MQNFFRNALYVSRPGLWATQLWFYLLPLGGRQLLLEPTFWLGAFYVMFPMSHLVYGWNDLADYQTDQLNPRKGNLLFGAKLSREELRRLPVQMLLVQLPFAALFVWLRGAEFLLGLAALAVVSSLYNSPRAAFKSRPVLDLLCQSGYLLVFVFSSWLNQVPQLPWPAFVFGALFAMHAHLFHEVTDLAPDRAAGRRTTAVAIGPGYAKLLVAAMLLVESAIMAACFANATIATFLGLAGVGFAIDGLHRPKQIVSESALRVVFIAWNAVALVSMYWVWREAVFVQLR
ncbi:MAG: UbiA family prenyltransferase [Planctomycetales bacterium]|nr:UbiA family prenyltransferase [Planctomycetales bacterium]